MPILVNKAMQIYMIIITKVIEDEKNLTVDVQISFLTLRAQSSHKGRDVFYFLYEWSRALRNIGLERLQMHL